MALEKGGGKKKVVYGSFRFKSIRSRLFLLFFSIALIFALTAVFTFYLSGMVTDRFAVLFRTNVHLERLSESTDRIKQSLEKFLRTNDRESLMNYYDEVNNLLLLEQGKADLKLAGESALLMSNLENLIAAFLAECDLAANAKRGRIVQEYVMHYERVSNIARYIRNHIERLNALQLHENTLRYERLSSALASIRRLTMLFSIFALLTCVVFFVLVSYQLTKPIIMLSQAAQSVSAGNYEDPPVLVDSHDEIELLATAFNNMTESIRSHIENLGEKATIERKLQEKTIENLAILNQLKDAELQALQSQINPHFLFNTMNAGTQLALLEGAERTCEFMEKMALLFRYNLRNIHRPATLLEELENLQHYVFILEARYGSSFEFGMELSTSINKENMQTVIMPRMILQPILENAFFHGIRGIRRGGRIIVGVVDYGSNIAVSIEDNGAGMTVQKVSELLSHFCSREGVNEHGQLKSQDKGSAQIDSNLGLDSTSRKGNGIGIQNVFRRLTLFYGDLTSVRIQSEPGRGTKVIILLPYEKSFFNDQPD